MTQTPHSELRDLLDRISRIASAEEWGGDLNPTQRAALSYLARANRFSRSPSQVADYLSATRGTVSQTLKALARKGYVEEIKSETDRRSIFYSVTDSGRAALEFDTAIATTLSAMSETQVKRLASDLKLLLRGIVELRNGRGFGLCRNCKHHRKQDGFAYCNLLSVRLAPYESEQICYEYEAA